MKGRNAYLIVLLFLLALLPVRANHVIHDAQIKSLQVTVNDNWLTIPILRLHENDILNVRFDELSHTYHHYLCHLEHCEDDWTPSEQLFDSDWLEGFNDLPIEDYAHSINTTVQYTNYAISYPNDKCRLKLSGNYRLHIYDEDQNNEEVITVEFRVLEPLMDVSLGVTTNTDIDINGKRQQVNMSLNYKNINVTNVDEQIRTVVMQNYREDNARHNVRPNFKTLQGLTWDHNRDLIFLAGNEYHKFETLDTSHPTMGIEYMGWDGERFNAYPFVAEPRPNYLYDEDANGAFLIRNSDYWEINTTCDYVWVHFQLKCPPTDLGQILIQGRWTLDQDKRHYIMNYDEQQQMYQQSILLKQGYYSYAFQLLRPNGTIVSAPSEGDYYQTENEYQALVYYKGLEERTWRLVGYQSVRLR